MKRQPELETLGMTPDIATGIRTGLHSFPMPVVFFHVTRPPLDTRPPCPGPVGGRAFCVLNSEWRES